jgi:hypothetical protein
MEVPSPAPVVLLPLFSGLPRRRPEHRTTRAREGEGGSAAPSLSSSARRRGGEGGAAGSGTDERAGASREREEPRLSPWLWWAPESGRRAEEGPARRRPELGREERPEERESDGRWAVEKK